MKALIAGAGGGLGTSLMVTAPGNATAIGLDRSQLDITDANSVSAALEKYSPEVVFNCAAWTDVDAAQTNPEQAHAINETGAANVAAACKAADAKLIHLSTDFVFDGAKDGPYTEDDTPNPLNVYGASKLAGEQRVQASGCSHLIVRTSWLYTLTPEKAFPHRVLAWAKTRKSLELAEDQFGSPTYAKVLAEALWMLARTDESGVLHWAGLGTASRLELGVVLIENALGMGAKLKVQEIEPVPAAKFNLPAPRPTNSSLDCSRAAALGIEPPAWPEMALEFVEDWMNR